MYFVIKKTPPGPSVITLILYHLKAQKVNTAQKCNKKPPFMAVFMLFGFGRPYRISYVIFTVREYLFSPTGRVGAAAMSAPPILIEDFAIIGP